LDFRVRIQVVESLRHSPVGQLIPITGFDQRFNEEYDVLAFLPDELPDTIEIPDSVWMTIAEAMADLGRLDAAAALVPNPTLVTRVATRREAVGTSALEGTYAELTELFAAEVLPFDEQDEAVAPNVREVMNYARAADLAYEWITEREISENMLSSLQSRLVRGTDSDGPEAGSVRETQVFIGAKHRRVSEARFVPPPAGDLLRDRYEQWVRWITDEQIQENVGLIVRVAVAHYQFETIHPYTDGNGRLGRLVAVLQLLREGVLRTPVLSVSPWLKDRAEEYRDHLLAISRTGEWGPWVDFFARAVSAEAKSGHERIMRLLALRDELSQRVKQELPRARLALDIAEDLIAYPILTVAAAENRHGRTNQANRNAIFSLVDLGILEPYGESRYDRLYWIPRVFQIIDG